MRNEILNSLAPRAQLLAPCWPRPWPSASASAPAASPSPARSSAPARSGPGARGAQGAGDRDRPGGARRTAPHGPYSLHGGNTQQRGQTLWRQSHRGRTTSHGAARRHNGCAASTRGGAITAGTGASRRHACGPEHGDRPTSVTPACGRTRRRDRRWRTRTRYGSSTSFPHSRHVGIARPSFSCLAKRLSANPG